MTNLYAEWKKLRDNVQSASARLYSEKNENTERKYEEALERLAQFEKENGIPLMADEAEVKKMFCPQTNKEYFTETDEELATFLARTCRDLLAKVVEDGGKVPNEYDEENRGLWLRWLKEIHDEI